MQDFLSHACWLWVCGFVVCASASLHSWPSHSHPLPSSTSQGCANPTLPPSADEWSGWGGNIYNNRWASQNTMLDSHNIKSIQPHCNITYAAGVSAAPTLSGNIAYFPTWSGLLVALDYTSCRLVWQLNVTALVIDFAPLLPEQIVTRPVSRTSPQVADDILYFGTLAHALLVAVDARTGAVLDTVQLNAHPLATITMSPTLYAGRLFVGVASQEEAAAGLVPGYECCSFVGNMVGVDFDRATTTLNIAWNTSMIPDAEFAQGWSGAAVWGSQPSIDEMRSQLFIATGNTYSTPAAIAQCQDATANLTNLLNDPCLHPSIWQESVLALDLTTGIPNWVHQLSSIDTWTLTCGVTGLTTRNATLCPRPGPDADFGMAPTFIAGGSAGSTPQGKDTVVIGQKNGLLHALSAQAGTLFWSTQTSPDGVEGGLIWGIAVDDERVYFTAANFDQAAFTLQPEGGTGTTIYNSGFGCAALVNGELVWEIQAPDNALSLAVPTVVGDVVLVCTTYPINVTEPAGVHGELLALDKYSGRVILDKVLDNVGYSGIAVQDEYVLFGTGYNGVTSPASFYVFKSGM